MFGVNILPCVYMTEYRQVRKPVSKKARVQKKWRKVSRNWATVPSTQVVILGNQVMAHPDTIPLLIRKLKAKNIRDGVRPNGYLFTTYQDPFFTSMMPVLDPPKEFDVERVLRRWRF